MFQFYSGDEHEKNDKMNMNNDEMKTRDGTEE